MPRSYVLFVAWGVPLTTTVKGKAIMENATWQ